MTALVASLALGPGNTMAGAEEDRGKPEAQHGQHHREMQKQARQNAEQQAKAKKAMGDKNIAGQRMHTAEERKRFGKQLQAAENDGERERIREEHRELIQQRVEAQKEMPKKG